MNPQWSIYNNKSETIINNLLFLSYPNKDPMLICFMATKSTIDINLLEKDVIDRWGKYNNGKIT